MVMLTAMRTRSRETLMLKPTKIWSPKMMITNMTVKMIKPMLWKIRTRKNQKAQMKKIITRLSLTRSEHDR